MNPTTSLKHRAALVAISLFFSVPTLRGQGNYPMTQTYERNPLFVNFPSWLYGQQTTGTFYSADPSARVWNIEGEEVLYVYCSHDVEPSQGCDRMDRYHIFSTRDLREWTDHGEVFNAEQVNAYYGSSQPGFMWAPDCHYNPQDKLYYYYFPKSIDWNRDIWKIFVATSSNPATGFELKGVVEGMPSAIDPHIFVDTNGQPYIYNGGGGKLYGGKLRKDDWTQLDGEMQPMQFSGESDFHEGAWVFKRGGRYYLTYPDNHSPQSGGNRLRYAMSNNPLGPWTERGVYMQPHGEETAHGSVVQFKGQWYQFYHTANYSGNGTLRSVCFDPIEFDARTGEIKLMHVWGTTKEGMATPQVALDRVTRIEAEHFNDGGSHYAWFRRPGNGEPQVLQEGDVTFVSQMKHKEWMRYSVSVSEPGTYAVTCRMRRRQLGSKFTVGFDGCWPRASFDLTAPLNQWAEVEVGHLDVTEAGEHYLEWRSQDGSVDIDWLQVERSQTKVPGTIEAEDFDKGGEGEAYHWQNQDAIGRGYRSDAIFIESHSGGHSLGWTSDGDWTRYTFKATVGGVYKVTTYASSDGQGAFKLLIDGSDVTARTTVAATGGWGTYKPFVAENITIAAGEHVLTFYCYGGMNVDRFVFECVEPDASAISHAVMPAESPFSGKVCDLLGRIYADASQVAAPLIIAGGKKYINHSYNY